MRKFPAAGEVFFSTFPFIELHRTWRELLRSMWSEDYLRFADDPLGGFMHCRFQGENVQGVQGARDMS